MKKIIIRILIISILFLLTAYIILNIYCNANAAKIDVNELIDETKIELSDTQLEIASFIFSKHANPEFKKLPLLTDYFSFYFQEDQKISSTHVDFIFIGHAAQRSYNQKCNLPSASVRKNS